MAISGGPPAARVRFAHTARSARKPRFFFKIQTLWNVVGRCGRVPGPCGALWKTRYDNERRCSTVVALPCCVPHQRLEQRLDYNIISPTFDPGGALAEDAT